MNLDWHPIHGHPIFLNSDPNEDKRRNPEDGKASKYPPSLDIVIPENGKRFIVFCPVEDVPITEYERKTFQVFCVTPLVITKV